MPDKKNTVFKATLLLSILMGLSKVLGFLREQVVAWKFGTSAAVDSYAAASAVPVLVAGILGGAIASAFMPVYGARLTKGSGRRLAGTVLATTGLISFVATIVIFAFAPQIISVYVPGFSLENQALTVTLLRIMAVLTLVMSLSQYITILFQAHKQFFWPALTPIIMNVIIAGGLLLHGDIQWLSWLSVLGMLVPVMLMIVVAGRRGLPLVTKLEMDDPAFKMLLSLSAPIFVGSLFGQLYLFVEKTLASNLTTGSVAALHYSNKLVQLPLGVFVMALSAALYPTLSEHAAKGDMASFARAMSSALRGVVLIMVPAAVGMFVLRYPIVRLAFERGSFDVSATTRTAQALGYYSLGLVGVALAQMLGRGFYSLQDMMTPVKIGVATAVVHVTLAYVLVGPMAHGGLALANSLGFLFNACVMYYFLSRKLAQGSIRVLPLLVKAAVASVAMAFTSVMILNLTVRFGQIISIGLAVGMGLGVYGILLMVLRVEEVSMAIKAVQLKLGL